MRCVVIHQAGSPQVNHSERSSTGFVTVIHGVHQLVVIAGPPRPTLCMPPLSCCRYFICIVHHRKRFDWLFCWTFRTLYVYYVHEAELTIKQTLTDWLCLSVDNKINTVYVMLQNSISSYLIIHVMTQFNITEVQNAKEHVNTSTSARPVLGVTSY